MPITEEDIFQYVLFPDKLSPDKKEYIKMNESQFEKPIEFYKSFMISLNDKEISELAKKAVRKIKALQKIISLYPVVNNKIPSNNFTLAAASQKIAEKQYESFTFSDDDSNYLLRFIKYNDKSTLYFFSKTENKNQNLKITLLPANYVLNIENTSRQIELELFDEIEKIMIEEE